jgi:hypothetical protein
MSLRHGLISAPREFGFYGAFSGDGGLTWSKNLLLMSPVMMERSANAATRHWPR